MYIKHVYQTPSPPSLSKPSSSVSGMIHSIIYCSLTFNCLIKIIPQNRIFNLSLKTARECCGGCPVGEKCIDQRDFSWYVYFYCFEHIFIDIFIKCHILLIKNRRKNFRRRRSKFSELVPNPFAERSCNKLCTNQVKSLTLLQLTPTSFPGSQSLRVIKFFVHRNVIRRSRVEDLNGIKHFL